MAASSSIGAIYCELRRILGDKIDRADALNFAASVVRFCLAHIRQKRQGQLRRDRERLEQPFEAMPIDLAMMDGGWRVLEYELDQWRPEIEVGRVHVYEAAASATARMFAAECGVIDAESERLFRSLDWLSLGEPRKSYTSRDDEWQEELFSGPED